MSLFELDHTQVKSLEELKANLLDNLLFLKSLNNREYLLFQKFETLHNIYRDRRFTETELNYVKEKIMTFADVQKVMENKSNSINLILPSSPKEKRNWLILRHFISNMDFKSTVGRSQMYYLEINNKIAGFLCLNSDFMRVGVRDKYIGWTNEDKTHKHRLNNTLLGGIIVPTQPFGFDTAAGKLMTLLILSNKVISNWENKYNNKIVAINTTSLFGAASQYNGMNKYFKVLGESNGTGIAIYPSQYIHLENYKFLNDKVLKIKDDILREVKKNQFPNTKEIEAIMTKILNYRIGGNHKEIKYCAQKANIENMNKLIPDTVKNKIEDYNLFGQFAIASVEPSFKTQLINLFYKYTNFKSYLKEQKKDDIDFHHGFKRGIIYGDLYTNTKEFLRNEITEDQLISKKFDDFDRKSIDSIFDYWKNKYGLKRWAKTLTENKDNPKTTFNYFLDTIMKRVINKYKEKFYSDDKNIIKDMFYDFLRFSEEFEEIKNESKLF